MAKEKFANNATSTLALSLDKASTELTVKSGTGVLFPSIEREGEFFYVTLVSVTGAMEIVKCTHKNIDVFTIERAQQGTVATSFLENSIVQHRLTAMSMNNITATSLATPVTIILTGKATSTPVVFDGTQQNLNIPVVTVGTEALEGILPIAKGGTGNADGLAVDSTKWGGFGQTISSAAPSGTADKIWFQYI